MLRQGKASELKKGGIWYYKNESGIFQVVINDMDTLGMSDDDFSAFCSKCSKKGTMYLNRDLPNFNLNKCMHPFDRYRLMKYNDKTK